MAQQPSETGDRRLLVGSLIIDVIVAGVFLLLERYAVVDMGVVTFVLMILVASTGGLALAAGVERIKRRFGRD